MQDIARKLNVSRSTVSLVLSGKSEGRVSESVRKKVLEAAKDMNYHLNELARSLRVGSSNLISVIVTDISNQFFGEFTFHIQEEAKKAGYLVLTVNSNESDEEFDQMARILISKQVDGIIAVPTPGGEPSLKMIQEQGLPLVTVDRLCEGLDADYVGVDNYTASKNAMRDLLKDGFRKVMAVRLDIDIPPLEARQRAYEDAMREAGLEDNIDVCRIRFGQGYEQDFALASKRLMAADAVFFTSYRVFTQGMALVSRAGGVPDGQCQLCFDDVLPYMNAIRDVRYIEQPVAEMARKSFELLLRQIQGERNPHKYVFPTRCISKYTR